jgi:hypothetical protein
MSVNVRPSVSHQERTNYGLLLDARSVAVQDFMRFCAFLSASIRKGLEETNRDRILYLSGSQSNSEIGLAGTRTQNQRPYG